MNPIKMKDGNLAYPIHSKDDMAAAEARGLTIEFTACGCSYDLPRHDARDSGGWILDPDTSTTCNWPLIDQERRSRGVLGIAKPTLWQRIKGWFA